jgi:DNA-binding beta-propeller fold protein YncE
MNTQKFKLVLALLAASTAAYPASLEGPRMGMVFDSSMRVLRPILGTPGAAIMGEPLKTGLDLRRVAISPQQDYALAAQGEHNEIAVLRFDHAPMTSTLVPGTHHGPDQMVFSPGGRVAAVHYKDGNRIQVLSGLPDSPKVVDELYLSAGALPSALAVGDDNTVLAGVGSSVYWVTRSGEVPVLKGVSKVSAIALTTARLALVADAVNNQIHRLQNLTSALETDVLAGPAQGIAAPVAVAVSSDSRRAFVANGKSGTVAILDLQGKTPVRKIACGCKLTGLDRLDGDNLFRLTEPSNRPMWVLEAGAKETRVVFVPADLARSSAK